MTKLVELKRGDKVLTDVGIGIVCMVACDINGDAPDSLLIAFLRDGVIETEEDAKWFDRHELRKLPTPARRGVDAAPEPGQT